MAACPRCQANNPDDARFCNACGGPIALGETDAASRRRVSAVFCDVVGSTELTARLDAEAAHGVFSRYWETMGAVAERHGGRVEKFIGDAVVAVFGVPLLHEDDALRAVRAASEMREALTSLNQELAADRGVTIATRTGVATGEVMAAGDPGAPHVLGSILNLAARLEQAASPGEVLLDDETARSVRGSIVAQEAEPVELKGFEGWIRPYRLLTVHEGVRESPLFVGRAEELALLSHVLESTARAHRCRVVTVIGDAGIGKSRLVDEVLRRSNDGPEVLTVRCPAYGGGPGLRPLGDALLAASVRRDTSGDVRGWLLDALGGAKQKDPDSVVSAALAALGIDAVDVGLSPDESLWAVRRVLESLAGFHLLALVLDDLQWGDPTLLDLVRHLAEWSVGAPLLVLCVARPDLIEVHPQWGRAPGELTLRLEPLPGEESRRLVRVLIGDDPAPAALEERIEAAAGGNPFFLEEIVNALQEEGALVRDPAAPDRVDDTDVVIPSTISSLLAARIDRLSAAERSVLERAAVLGAGVDMATLTGLTQGAGTDVTGALASLKEKDLLVPAETPGELRFRHDLTRDAAYAAIPRARRAELHERAAELLEGRPGQEGIVGFHLEQARASLEVLGPGAAARAEQLGARAARNLERAGRAASERGDVRTAAGFLKRAVALLDPVAPFRMQLLADLHDALLYAGATEEAGAVVAELLGEIGPRAEGTLAERARMQQTLFRFLVDPSTVPSEELRGALDRAVAAFEAANDEVNLATAYGTRAMVGWLEGDAAAMAADAEQGLVLARHSGNRRALTDAAAALATSLLRGPVPLREAISRLQELIGDLEGDRGAQAALRLDLAVMLATRGATEEARAEAEHALEVFRDLGQRRWLPRCTEVFAEIAAIEGSADEAAELRRSVHASFVEQGDASNGLAAAAGLADSLMDAGRVDEADVLAAQIERDAPEDDLEIQVTWRVVRARAASVRGEDSAVRLAEAAVALADRTDFLLLQADARADLAAVLDSLGRHRAGEAVRADAVERYARKGADSIVARLRERI